RVSAIGLEHDARGFFRPGRAALDEAADREAVVAAVDQPALRPGFLRPADLRKAAVERGVIVAAVELVLALERRDGGDLIGHLALCDEIAAAELDAVQVQILGHDVKEPLAEEVGLEAAGPAIGADPRPVCY